MQDSLRRVQKVFSQEMRPSIVETASITSSAFIGAFVADVATFYVALLLLFAPTVFLIGYLVFLIKGKKPRKPPKAGIGVEDWLLSVTTGFLFGSTYLLVKLAPTIPILWIVVATLFFTLSLITFFNVWMKRTVKSSLEKTMITVSQSPGSSHVRARLIVAAFVVAALGTVAVYDFRDAINIALGSTTASQVLLIVLIFVTAVGGVAVPLLTRRSDRRSRELLRHYEELRLDLQRWSREAGLVEQSPSIFFRGELLVEAMAPMYLTTGLSRSTNFFSDRRVLQHLTSEKYKALRSVVNRIYALEDDHNASVSSLHVEITADVKQMLQHFPTLRDWSTGARSNYYQSGNIVSAVEQQASAGLMDQSTNVYWGGNVFADVADPVLRSALSNEVSRLVEGYRRKVQDRRDDLVKMNELTGEMTALIGEVVDQIDVYRRLDGECDFEKKLR